MTEQIIPKSIRLTFGYKDITYCIIISNEKGGDIKCKTIIYKFYTNKDNENLYESTKNINNDIFDKLYNKIIKINIKEEVIKNTQYVNNEGNTFKISLNGGDGGIDIKINGVKQCNIGLRNLSNRLVRQPSKSMIY
jgi:hypothetical protein